MKLFVGNILLSLCITLFPVVPDSGRAKCKCRPSPPGGVTVCESGQVAVCGNSDGVCKGSCISVNDQLQPLQYSAVLFSEVFGRTITEKELRDRPKDSENAVKAILKSDREDKDVTVQLGNMKHKGSFGLSEVSRNKLMAAAQTLGQIYKAQKAKAHKHTTIVVPTRIP